MKKHLLFFGIICIMFAAAPQVSATDKDVGLTFELSADYNAVVIDCQADVFSPEFIKQLAVRDPGDLSLELRAQSSGLRAKPADYKSNCSDQAGITVNNSSFREHYGTRINHFSIYRTYIPTVSTSNGGAGY